MIPSVVIMLKPASGLCNLRCKYCFYADEACNRSIPNFGMMSEETTKNILLKAINHASHNCHIAFQGGEPTLRGLDYFKMVVDFVEKNNERNINISYAIQTNGILIDEEWCKFFKKNNFLVGISLDGIKEIHDANRIDANGKGTFLRVMNTIKLLKKYDVDFNILTVLTEDICRRYKQVHSFYKKNNFDFQQFIVCLDPIGEERGSYPWSLSVKRYGEYLKSSFDCWYEDLMSGHKSYHRFFDNLMLMINGNYPDACGMLGQCSHMYVCEADGSTYPCDFYMIDKYYLGNLNENSMDEIDAKRAEIKFIEESFNINEECRKCKHFKLCRGGCRRDRDYFEKGLNKNFYCEAYKSFFDYATPKLIEAYSYMISCMRNN